MSRRVPGLALLVSWALACGRAEDGAAVVHGRLYEGTPWDTSFELVCGAEVHGAGPFVVDIAAPADERALSGHFIRITRTRLPASGEELSIGAEHGAEAVVMSLKTQAPAAGEPEAEVQYPDGGFVARATGGSVTVELDGTRPGDGVRGTFRLELAGGVVSGRFAAALAD